MPPKRKQAAAKVVDEVEKMIDAEPKLKLSKADSDKEDEPVIEATIPKKGKTKETVDAVKRPLRTQTRVNYNENETKVKAAAKPKTAKARTRKAAPATEDQVNDDETEPVEVNKASSEEKEDIVDKEVKEKKQKGRPAKSKVVKAAPVKATIEEKEDEGVEEEEEEEEGEEDEVVASDVKPTKELKTTKKGRGKKAVKEDGEDEDGEEEPKSKKNRKRRKVPKVNLGYKESSDGKSTKEVAGEAAKEEEKDIQSQTNTVHTNNANNNDSSNGGGKAVEEKIAEEDGPADMKQKDKKVAAGTRISKASKNNEKVKGDLINQVKTDLTKIDFSCEKKNKLNQLPNYKIVSWNLDGLRACLKKGGLKYIENEDADIVCLQETKCSEDKIPAEVLDLAGYRKFWAASVKDGYAGVGLFAKHMPIEVQKGINVEEFDQEGRCIMAEFRKFIVVCVYVPNSGRKLITLDKRLEWNKVFKSYIQELEKKKPVIICGDLNVAHQEIDIANPKTNKRNAGFTQEERDHMTDFLKCGYVDVYRAFYPRERNCYTFWSYMMNARRKNIGWRLDYFLISERYMSSICDVSIRSDVFGSDHCPIVLYLNLN